LGGARPERDGEVISNTVLMAQSLDCAAKMAETLGLPGEAAAHNALAERLRAAVNGHGWSDEYQDMWIPSAIRPPTSATARCVERGIDAGTFEDFLAKQRVSEPTNTLVLLCNAVPPDRGDAVMRFVMAAKDGEFVGSSPWYAHLGSPGEIVPVGSPWFLFFTLETLFRERHPDDALTILREQWNRMLEKGATTFWETFPGKIVADTGPRLCHGWSRRIRLSTQVLQSPAAPGYSQYASRPSRSTCAGRRAVRAESDGAGGSTTRTHDNRVQCARRHEVQSCSHDNRMQFSQT
jgi:hypothetical protein